MHHFISLIFSFLLSPLNWIIGLMIVSFLVKRQKLKRISRYLVVGIFLIFSNQWLLDTYARHWQPAPRNIAGDSAYSCGILLGGYCGVDMFTGDGYFNYSADRFIQAARLYKTGKIRHIFISGGNGKTENGRFRVGEWTKGELKAMGIPDEAILYEDISDNTEENAVNTKKALSDLHFKPPYVLITSASHMPRAALIFKNAGMDTISYPCNYVDGKDAFQWSELIPNPEMLMHWGPFLKETAAFLWYKLKGK